MNGPAPGMVGGRGAGRGSMGRGPGGRGPMPVRGGPPDGMMMNGPKFGSQDPRMQGPDGGRGEWSIPYLVEFRGACVTA